MSDQPRRGSHITILLILFIAAFTGFNYLRQGSSQPEHIDGYNTIDEFGLYFIAPEEVDTYHIGITEDTISENSGWFIAKLGGDSKQYGVIWARGDQIPSNYTHDLDGFTSYVLDRVEESGVVFSDEGEIIESELGKHQVSEQLFHILEGETSTPVLTGSWCCEENDLYIMVYSLLSPDAGSLEDLADIWGFYAQNVKCCEAQ